MSPAWLVALYIAGFVVWAISDGGAKRAWPGIVLYLPLMAVVFVGMLGRMLVDAVVLRWRQHRAGWLFRMASEAQAQGRFLYAFKDDGSPMGVVFVFGDKVTEQGRVKMHLEWGFNCASSQPNGEWSAASLWGHLISIPGDWVVFDEDFDGHPAYVRSVIPDHAPVGGAA